MSVSSTITQPGMSEYHLGVCRKLKVGSVLALIVRSEENHAEFFVLFILFFAAFAHQLSMRIANMCLNIFPVVSRG